MDDPLRVGVGDRGEHPPHQLARVGLVVVRLWCLFVYGCGLGWLVLCSASVVFVFGGLHWWMG